MESAEGSASAHSPRGGETHLGPWRIQATQLLIHHRPGEAQQFLMAPPHDFRGHIRLGVIAGDRREEFLHAWSGAHAEPLLFAVPLPEVRSPGPVRADLLLEVWESRGRTGRGTIAKPPEMLSGTLAFMRAAPGARIYFSPLLPPPADGTAPRGGAPLKAALRALERGKKLRGAIAADWVARVVVEGLEERVRALAGTGRLEILATRSCDPLTLPRLRLTVSPRTAWIVGGQPQWEPSALSGDIANLLIAVEAHPPPGSPFGASGPIPALVPLRFPAGSRWTIAHGYSTGIDWGALQPAEDGAAAVRIDGLLRGSLRWRSGPAEQHQLHALAFCPVLLETEQAWKQLHGFVGRWNRRHLSPQLIPATLADYFAAVEELEHQGVVRIPAAYPPGEMSE
jgi:hypothetical protein